MTTLIKRIVVISLIWASCLLANNTEFTLTSLAQKLSFQNNITIYLDEDLKDKKVSLFIPDKITNKDFLKLFKNTIKKNDMSFIKNGPVYHLVKNKVIKSDTFLYKLKYNSFKDCDNTLKQLKAKYIYLSDTNSFLITATKDDYLLIKSFLDIVDLKQKQVTLKIMIFEFTDNDYKEKGLQLGSMYKDINGALQTSLNAIIAPLSTNMRTMSNINFYMALKLLNDKKLLTINQFPYILAKNNHIFKFEAVENIPFLVRTTKTDATNTSEENSINYKDVGLKINGKSLIYDDYITLDIDLVIEDLINESEKTQTPQTYKRHLNSNTNINYNDVLLLSGIKRTKNEINKYSIPILSKIPFLGDIFKFETNSDKELNITIAIEVIK